MFGRPQWRGEINLVKNDRRGFAARFGTRKLGHQVNLGYFSQTRLDVLNPNRTVFEELMSATERSVPQAQARTLLGVFNFRG